MENCNKQVETEEKQNHPDWDSIHPKFTERYSDWAWSDWNSNENNQQEDWSVEENYSQSEVGIQTYQQLWEQNNLNYQDAQNFINIGFEVEHYNEVLKWKATNLDILEIKNWLGSGINKGDYDFAYFLKKDGYRPEDSNEDNLKELRKKCSWQDIHEKFDFSSRKIWEDAKFNKSESRGLIKLGFAPWEASRWARSLNLEEIKFWVDELKFIPHNNSSNDDYTLGLIDNWKNNFTKEELNHLFKNLNLSGSEDDYKFIKYWKNNGTIPKNQIDLDILIESEIPLQNWLDFWYPKDNRNKVETFTLPYLELSIRKDEFNLSVKKIKFIGDLNLSDFVNLKEFSCWESISLNKLCLPPKSDKLKTIDLSNNKNLKIELSYFGQFKNLTELYINKTNCSGYLKDIKNLKLKLLSLEDTKINPDFEWLDESTQISLGTNDSGTDGAYNLDLSSTINKAIRENWLLGKFKRINNGRGRRRLPLLNWRNNSANVIKLIDSIKINDLIINEFQELRNKLKLTISNNNQFYWTRNKVNEKFLFDSKFGFISWLDNQIKNLNSQNTLSHERIKKTKDAKSNYLKKGNEKISWQNWESSNCSTEAGIVKFTEKSTQRWIEEGLTQKEAWKWKENAYDNWQNIDPSFICFLIQEKALDTNQYFEQCWSFTEEEMNQLTQEWRERMKQFFICSHCQKRKLKKTIYFSDESNKHDKIYLCSSVCNEQYQTYGQEWLDRWYYNAVFCLRKHEDDRWRKQLTTMEKVY